MSYYSMQKQIAEAEGEAEEAATFGVARNHRNTPRKVLHGVARGGKLALRCCVGGSMAGFSKLFSSLLDSSVWRESMPTRIVWITMLAACDYDGYVDLSPHGLAHRAKVTLDEAVAAIVVLSSPDAESRTKDNEGRRIEVLDEGFVILNYAKYRERAQAKEGGRAPYYRAWRARRRAAAFKDDEGEER